MKIVMRLNLRKKFLPIITVHWVQNAFPNKYFVGLTFVHGLG